MDQATSCLTPINGFLYFCAHSKVLAMAYETLCDGPTSLSHILSLPTLQAHYLGSCQPRNYLQYQGSLHG